MNKKFIMKKAVAMARKMEGDWQARMALALKKVWAMVKEAQKNNKAEKEEMNFNEWAKYGYHRVYFEGKFSYKDIVRNGITNKLVEVDTYVHIKGFYDVEKGYIKFNLNIRIEEKMRDEFKKIAVENAQTPSMLIRKWIEEYIKENKKIK